MTRLSFIYECERGSILSLYLIKLFELMFTIPCQSFFTPRHLIPRFNPSPPHPPPTSRAKLGAGHNGSAKHRRPTTIKQQHSK